jgi:starch-binding outer membrane protein, SusD/RagB family
MKKSKFIILVFTALLINLQGCNDDFLDITNPNSYTEESYFNTPEQLLAAVSAAYYGFYHTGLFMREWYFYHDMLGNDAMAAPAIVGTGSMGQLPSLTYDGTNSEIQNLWRALYRIVLRAAIALDKSKDFEPLTLSEVQIKNDIMGESSFLQAWAYFTLYRFWGQVPLRKSIEDMAVNDFSRAMSNKEVVDHILELLSTAEEYLRVQWPDEFVGRATRGAAVALRGQLYMWEKDYSAALGEFNKLAQAPYSYALVPDFGTITTEAGDNSVESVFEIQHAFNADAVPWSIWVMFNGQEDWAPDQAVTGRAMEFGFNDWWNTFVSKSLVESFTYDINGTSGYVDPRAYHTFYGDAVSGGDIDFFCEDCDGNVQPYPFEEKGYSWKKYQRYEILEKEDVPQSPINSKYLRYADVLLQKAECHLMINNNTTEALILINQVRARSGAELYNDLGSNPMAILKRERRLELGGEQVRFWDLIRWGELVQTLNPEKQAQGEGQPYQEKHRLFPIPIDELEINKLMRNDLNYPGWN